MTTEGNVSRHTILLVLISMAYWIEFEGIAKTKNAYWPSLTKVIFGETIHVAASTLCGAQYLA